jgi:UDP-N-acetylglucosamine 2-epimerase (non-hydrolysing)
MSGSFLKELNLPKPDIYLGVGSGTQAEQTGKIMMEFEKVCLKERPELVVVVGDVNSTLACALTAAKLCIPLAHVEAGLRSYDRTMPEEINRLLTDQLAGYLFTTCEDANKNLIKEGIPKKRIFFVGNVMIDTLLNRLKMAHGPRMLENLGLKESSEIEKYALLTLHRPSNVDNPLVLRRIIGVLVKLAKEIPIIFPVHPRTLKQIKKFGLLRAISPLEDFMLLPPLGYLEFLSLMSRAALVLTDSGGIQEETTILGIPCLTLRENTERPITVRQGTNIIVGTDSGKILRAARRVLRIGIPRKRIPRYWDGKAAARIVNILSCKSLSLQENKANEINGPCEKNNMLIR